MGMPYIVLVDNYAKFGQVVRITTDYITTSIFLDEELKLSLGDWVAKWSK